jgi:hypothetical protein
MDGGYNIPGIYSSVSSGSNPPKTLKHVVGTFVDEAVINIKSDLLERIKSEDIKEIRDNSDILEYTTDGSTWKPIQGKSKNNVVYLGDFTGNNNEVKIQKAIDYASTNNIKTVLLEDVTYIVSSGIIVKPDIKLIGGYGTSFTVYGANHNVLEIQKNASVEGFKIHIDDSNFVGNVIYLDGKYKYYNSWNRSAIRDLTIVDWNDYRKCTGVKLYSGLDGDEISFLEFNSLKLTNLDIGISFEVVRPVSGTSYVNANQFNNVTIEGCNEMIHMSSGITIPNECTGNIFTNLQIQPSYATQKLFTICGGYNIFNGMVWDLQLIPHSNDVIFLTDASEYTTFNIQNMPISRTSDLGRANDLGNRTILENRTSDPSNPALGQMWFRSDL